VPVRQKIADLEKSIEELRVTIENSRGADRAAVEKMLGELARLRAERLRLMEHQFSPPK
jgi:hypothetical protein